MTTILNGLLGRTLVADATTRATGGRGIQQGVISAADGLIVLLVVGVLVLVTGL